MADLGKKPCRNCGSAHEAHTRRTKACTVCTRFTSLRSNAAHVRRTGKAPGLGCDLAEFAAWFARQDRSCAYCRVPEEYVRHLRLRTQVGLPLQRLGVDRVDGERGYEIGNIVLCCFACNKARSNTFSAAEMEIAAEGISKVWTMRLEEAGIAWRRPSRSPATAAKKPAARRARKGVSSRSAKHRSTTAR